MRLRLESRASAPGRCEHCDDEIEPEAGPRFCERCTGNGWLQRLDERFENGEGITPMGLWRDRIEWGRELHPLVWRFGAEADMRQPAVALYLGPWTFYVTAVQA